MARYQKPPPPSPWPRLITLALVVLAVAGLAWWWLRPPPVPQLVNAPPQNARIACFGDSLVAGVGAETGENSYPARLAALLEAEVVALGQSGDTTGSALTRLNHFGQERYGVVVVTLGGNDILRRVEWRETEANLRQIFAALQEQGAVVAFTGVTSPLSFGRNQDYRRLCDELGVLFIPDILSGILTNPDLKADAIHPNATGYRLMAERVAAALRRARLVE